MLFLFLGSKRSGAEKLSTREYNGRNGRLPRADVSTDPGPQGLCPKLLSRVEHAGRSFDVSSLLRSAPPGRRYIILLTICPKAVKAAGFPGSDAEARGNGSDSHSVPGGRILLQSKFSTDGLFFSWRRHFTISSERVK